MNESIALDCEGTDRNRFYQPLADVIRVWWGVYGEDVDNKRISLTRKYFTDGNGSSEFSPRGKYGEKVIYSWNCALQRSMEYHFKGFLGESDLSAGSRGRDLAESDFVRERIQIAGENGERYSTNANARKSGRYSVRKDILSGIASATSIATKVISFPDFSPDRATKTAILLSKITARHLRKFEEPSFRENFREVASPNSELLKEFGYGTAMGCPASMRPSDECVEFLEANGLPHRGIMLADFMKRVQAHYDEVVSPYLRTLN